MFQDIVDLALQVQYTALQTTQPPASSSHQNAKPRPRQPISLHVAGTASEEDDNASQTASEENDLCVIEGGRFPKPRRKVILEPWACCGKTGHKEDSCIQRMSQQLAEMQVRMEMQEGKGRGPQ